MNVNCKKWIRLFLFVVPILLVLTGVNYLADPANVFHNFSEDMSQAMLDGNAVQVNSNNMDDREVLQRLIEKMPKQPDGMVWGSSIALCIDGAMAGEEEFYNMAVSSADYYDLMACMAMLQLNGVQAERVILTLDSRLFDPQVYMTDGRHDRLMDYSLYMIDYLSGNVQEGAQPELASQTGFWEKCKQLFSLSYFQWSVEYIKTNGLEVLTAPRWQLAEAGTTANHYLPDYSLVYSAESEAVTAEEIVEACRVYWLEANVTEYAMANEENMELFEKLIIYLQEQGTEVELFLCPFAPALWDRISETQYPMLFQLEEFAADLSKRYGLKVYGSYDPYQLGMTNEDFYDARHVKKASLERVFADEALD